MPRIRSLNVTYGVLVVALSSLAVAACGGGGSTKPATSVHASSTTTSTPVSVGTGVHVTNTPTKAFRVKSVNTTESVALGPKGYPVYTFHGENTNHIICQKTASAKTNCWGFWPPVSVRSSDAISQQS